MRRITTCYGLVSLMIFFSANISAAPRVTARGTDAVGCLKQTLRVRVENFHEWLNTDPKPDASRLVLFLDGRPLKGVPAIPPPDGGDVLRFDLLRNDGNRDVWNTLMRRPGFGPRSVELSVGPEAGPRFPTDAALALEIIREPWVFWLGTGLFLLLLAGFTWIARSSDVLREPGPQPDGVRPDGRPNRKCYSLARFQMAFWFFVVVGAYLFLWTITSDRDTLTPTVLTLIGISAATGLGAFVVDAGKRRASGGELAALRVESAKAEAAVQASPNAERAALEARAKEMRARIAGLEQSLGTEPSRNFIEDILSDEDGVSFHRFQIFVWTVVLGIVFAVSVYTDLAMPEFSASLLGLMGISSGTYLGFKIPERQS